MPGGSEYEAVKLFAQALHERDHANYDRAAELLDEVILFCEGSSTPTCGYLNRAAHIALFGIYQTLGRDEAAARCRRKAVKIGITVEELGEGVP
jgi:hypothetical protein